MEVFIYNFMTFLNMYLKTRKMRIVLLKIVFFFFVEGGRQYIFQFLPILIKSSK